MAIAIDEPDARAFVARIAEHAGSAQQTEFVLVFFSKALFAAADLAAAFAAQAPGLRYGGCSTAGEITPDGMREGNALALLFPRESFRVASAMVREISTSGLERVALEVERLKLAVLARADDESATAGIFALSLIDGLSFAEEAVTSAIHWALDDIPLLGGSAGDDMSFEAPT